MYFTFGLSEDQWDSELDKLSEGLLCLINIKLMTDEGYIQMFTKLRFSLPYRDPVHRDALWK